VPEDGVTVAGPVPGYANAWTIVTHSGITMGPLLGRLIAEEMIGGATDPRLAGFRPERFAAVRTDHP
jgi:glycine/D-amino acid oxidase-like deaminating enzyme